PARFRRKAKPGVRPGLWRRYPLVRRPDGRTRPGAVAGCARRKGGCTMQVRVSLTQILSRVVAVLLLAVPLVLLAQAIHRHEQEMIGQLSHQELLEHLREGQKDSFPATYFTLGVLSLAYLALVEAVAALLRMGVMLLRRLAAPGPVQEGCTWAPWVPNRHSPAGGKP